jgi:hypothetical protein
MSLRGLGQSHGADAEPRARVAEAHEAQRPATRSGVLGSGTLACARCDAPVAIGPAPLSLTHQLMCPYCQNRGALRDFLSLAPPTRPARVVIRVTVRATADGAAAQPS